MASVCLPSDALLQHLPSYLGFSYLGRGVSFHGCSSKAQPLLLTLDKGYFLTAALTDLQCGISPLGPPAPAQPRLLGRGVGPPGHCPWPRSCGCSSPPPPLALGLGVWGSSSRPTRPFRTNTQKRCPFHYRGLECKSRTSRNTWSNRQIWPWNME